MKKTLAIYGAKSQAVGTYTAIEKLYPEYAFYGFIVKSLQDNPHSVLGYPVHELHMVENKKLCVLIATPENLHQSIICDLQKFGFRDYICLNSKRHTILMEKYFNKIGCFPSIHALERGKEKSSLCVYMAKFHKDNILKNTYDLPEWLFPIQVGAALTDIRLCLLRDNQGTNISLKNVNYSELTALYWMWKNTLQKHSDKKLDYYGLFHYRRILDLHEEDLMRLSQNKIDVVLPLPLLHAPSILEHHTRYVKEKDWQAMYYALQELQPAYAAALPTIFEQPYFYNYNIIIAKSKVLNDYCSWLFPILERTEQLSSPKGQERADRYIGYLGENLLTLYFLYNKDRLNIAHAGCKMLL